MATIKSRLQRLEQRQTPPSPVQALFWTIAEWQHYQRTGEKPPQREKAPPPPVVVLFSDTFKPLTVLRMDINEL